MSRQATGEGGVILGSGAYWERVNRSTVFGKLMQNAAATDYQRTLRDTAARAAAAAEEVYQKLQKDADALPDMSAENRNALAKQLRGLYDIGRMCGVSCSRAKDCLTLLDRAAFRKLGSASTDARAVENAVAKIRNSPQFFQSEAADIVRRAVTYGVSSAVGSSAQKAAFLKDVMQGKGTDFLKAVLAAYSGGTQTQIIRSTIGSREYRERIEKKVFLQTLPLTQGDNYERMLTDALRRIGERVEYDLSQNVREHNYITSDTARALRAALAELRACGVSTGAAERAVDSLDWFVGGDAGKIRRLQAALNETGMVTRLTEDGVYGEKTEEAEEHFVQILINNLEEVLKNKAAVRCINVYLSARLYIAEKTGGGAAYRIKDVLYNNRKTIQRLIWKLGAEYYLRPRGYDVAALLLEHSLESSPSDLYFSQNHWVTQKIINSKGFKDAFSELEKKIQENPDVYAESGELEMDFQGDAEKDLYYGLGKFKIRYICKRQNFMVKVELSIRDKYNFDEIRSISANIESGIQFHFADLGNLANDAGLLSQADGVISIFHTHIEFEKIIKLGGARP